MPSLRVLGQDPSMNNWGLVAANVDIETYDIEVVEMLVLAKPKQEASVKKQVRTNSRDLDRSRVLSEGLTAFIDKYDFHLTMVEIPHGSQSANGMKSYGICLGLLGSITMPMIQLQEAECKVNAVGSRSATKKQMIEWAMSEHPAANWKMRKSKGVSVSVDGYNEHIADAVSAIHAGILTDQFQAAATMARRMVA